MSRDRQKRMRFWKAGRRRAAVLASLVAVVAVLLSACSSTGGASGAQPDPVGKDDLQLVMVIRTYATPYEAELVKGAQAYADHVGIPLKVITTDGDSQKQLSLVKAARAMIRTCGWFSARRREWAHLPGNDLKFHQL